MATKRPQPAAVKGAGAKTKTRPSLRPADTPGVFLNDLNVPCDERGIALDFLQLRNLDRANYGAVIDDTVDSPAKYLKALALDPRMSTLIRMDAAKAAAPYFDRRAPISVDGGVGTDGTVQPINMAMLAALPQKELEAALALFTKLGVAL